MNLPVATTLEPMLAALSRRLPTGDGLVYEPKWDGFRCLAFRDGGEIDLRSRNRRPLARYFPELVGALRRTSADRYVIDGEIVVTEADRFDFTALLARLHPAPSRVARLSEETPASFIAFDLVALGEENLSEIPFSERRALLESVVDDSSARVTRTPSTLDPSVAAGWLEQPGGSGVDGVVVKASDLRYQPGRRAMIKVKRERTADCVVGGFRLFAEDLSVSSLLLGLYDDDGVLHHVGVASSFAAEQRRDLAVRLRPLGIPLEGHDWEHGFGVAQHFANRLRGGAGRWTPDMGLDWIPLEPRLVCEVAYDRWDHGRFRHPARFQRWRDERDPRSCTTDQFAVAEAGSPVGLLTSG